MAAPPQGRCPNTRNPAEPGFSEEPTRGLEPRTPSLPWRARDLSLRQANPAYEPGLSRISPCSGSAADAARSGRIPPLSAPTDVLGPRLPQTVERQGAGRVGRPVGPHRDGGAGCVEQGGSAPEADVGGRDPTQQLLGAAARPAERAVSVVGVLPCSGRPRVAHSAGSSRSRDSTIAVTAGTVERRHARTLRAAPATRRTPPQQGSADCRTTGAPSAPGARD
jgi:hypothetical protein